MSTFLGECHYPISEIAEEYEVDPVKDLRPVCPNCHAMIHRRSPPLSIEELQVLLSGSKFNRLLTMGVQRIDRIRLCGMQILWQPLTTTVIPHEMDVLVC